MKQSKAVRRITAGKKLIYEERAYIRGMSKLYKRKIK